MPDEFKPTTRQIKQVLLHQRYGVASMPNARVLIGGFLYELPNPTAEEAFLVLNWISNRLGERTLRPTRRKSHGLAATLGGAHWSRRGGSLRRTFCGDFFSCNTCDKIDSLAHLIDWQATSPEWNHYREQCDDWDEDTTAAYPGSLCLACRSVWRSPAPPGDVVKDCITLKKIHRAEAKRVRYRGKDAFAHVDTKAWTCPVCAESFVDLLGIGEKFEADHVKWCANTDNPVRGYYDSLNADDDDDDDAAAADDDDAAGSVVTVHDYHHHKRLNWYSPIVSPWTRASGKTPIYFGVELEVVAKDNQARIARKQLGSDYVCVEADGSVQDGFELITQPAGLDVHRERLARLNIAGRSHDTDCCGLHVHVSRNALTPLQIGKMIAFVNDPRQVELIYVVARRYGSNRYAMIKEKRVSDRLTERYDAINAVGKRTVEFRLFRGTLKYESMIACLEFTYAVIRFCAVASMNDLTTAKFLEFISTPRMAKDTRYLREILHGAGMSVRRHLPKLEPIVVRETTIPTTVIEAERTI